MNIASPERLSDLSSLLSESAAQLDLRSTIDTLMRGGGLDVDKLLGAARGYLTASVSDAARMLSMLLIPIVLLAVVRQLTSGGDKKLVAASYVCYLTAALALMDAFHACAGSAISLASTVGRWITALFPVLTALLVACGATTGAGALAPLIALGSGMLSGLISTVSVTLCSAAAAVAVAGNLSERFSLGKLLSMMKSLLVWMIGLSLTGFLGLTAMISLIASAQDSAAMRAAKYAVGSIIPGVGGEVADTMGSAMSSAILIKNATGVTGIVALFLLCVRPLIQLALALAAVRVCSAVTEPLDGGQLQKLVDRFGDVLSMLLVAAIGAVVIGVVLAGAVLSIGNAAILPG